jgi:hypothetical protein
MLPEQHPQRLDGKEVRSERDFADIADAGIAVVGGLQ